MSFNTFRYSIICSFFSVCLVSSVPGLHTILASDTVSVFDSVDALVTSNKLTGAEAWSEKVDLVTGHGKSTAFTLEERFPCGSGVLLKLRKEWRKLPRRTRAEIMTKLTLPGLGAEQTHITADGNFRIHYTTHAESLNAISSADRNGNNLPDCIDALESSLIHSWSIEVLEMGWAVDEGGQNTPFAGILDVFVSGCSGAVNGFAFFKNMHMPFSGLDSLYMVIAPDVLEKKELMQVTMAHLLSHVLQFFYSGHMEAWWSEGVATWMEARVYEDIPRYRAFLNLRFRHPEISLTSDQGLMSFSSCLWAFFLSERFGDQIILDIFKRSRIYTYETVLNLTDRELSENWDSDVISAFREYAIWNFFTRRRDDGNHYKEGALWEWIQPFYQHDIFPVETITGEETLGSFGASYIRFLPDGSRGGIVLSLASLGPSRIIGDIITVSDSHSKNFDVIPVGGNIKEGTLDIGIPWHDFSEIILVVMRVDQLYPGGVALAYSAVYNSDIPVEFSAFVVNSLAGENTLIWTTEKENHNYGYLVYRSADLSTDFTNISPTVIPAIGDASSQTRYMYIDSNVRPGVRYNYFIRAFTAEGIHFDSYILSSTGR